MIFHKNYIKVRFEANDRVVLGDTGVTLIRPEMWVERDRNDEIRTNEQDGSTRFGYNVDRKEVNPQICVVIAGNEKFPYKIGDRLFVHYMAYESLLEEDIETLEAVIDAKFVFFKIENNEIGELANDIYIGEPIINDEVVTPSGILVEQGKRDNLRVKITHVSKPYYKEIKAFPGSYSPILTEPCVQVGDIAVAIDKYNYDFKFNGKTLIKLTSGEIAGVYGKAV